MTAAPSIVILSVCPSIIELVAGASRAFPGRGTAQDLMDAA